MIDVFSLLRPQCVMKSLKERNSSSRNYEDKFMINLANYQHMPFPVTARFKAWVYGWDCGFEFRRGHRCLSLVSGMYCKVEFSASGRSLIQGSPTEYGASNERNREAPIRPQSGIRSKRRRINIISIYSLLDTECEFIHFNDTYTLCYFWKFFFEFCKWGWEKNLRLRSSRVQVQFYYTWYNISFVVDQCMTYCRLILAPATLEQYFKL
jgi:hypothetical protein